MKNYNTFYFEKVEFNAQQKTITLSYSLDAEIYFSEQYRLGFDFAPNYSEEALEKALFGLWIAAGTTYYKTFVPENLALREGAWSKEQIEFFHNLYIQGLGEFLYTNKIGPAGKFNFVNPASVDAGANKEAVSLPNLKGSLLAIGGGKDSLVTAEIFKSQGIAFGTFVVNHASLMQPLLNKIGADSNLQITRQLSANIYELNEQGAYNGHVPITGILSFLSICTAILSGRENVVFSNENSANQGSTEYKGIKINHQYSKSLEFEQDFQNYIKTFITPSVRYFSFLRPLTELQIAELFIQNWFEKYRGLFSSCNRNFSPKTTQDKMFWCGQCPKCAFVFGIFAPFLEKDKLITLFGGKNLFVDSGLKKTYEELLGISGIKPFECVGEINEMRAALTLAKQTGNYPELNEFNFPETEFDYKTLREHSMPPEFRSSLQAFLNNTGGPND